MLASLNFYIILTNTISSMITYNTVIIEWPQQYLNIRNAFGKYRHNTNNINSL